METKVTGCDLESRPTFHHTKKITGDAQEAQVECDDNSIYLGKRPSATCKNGIWYTQGECRQYFWHNPVSPSSKVSVNNQSSVFVLPLEFRGLA